VIEDADREDGEDVDVVDVITEMRWVVVCANRTSQQNLAVPAPTRARSRKE
jgi:hypothetical protein